MKYIRLDMFLYDVVSPDFDETTVKLAQPLVDLISLLRLLSELDSIHLMFLKYNWNLRSPKEMDCIGRLVKGEFKIEGRSDQVKFELTQDWD